jgi:hypothetical protein
MNEAVPVIADIGSRVLNWIKTTEQMEPVVQIGQFNELAQVI